ncbi:hypothetical protein EAO77_37645, partial [Streptomyces sp. t39]
PHRAPDRTPDGPARAPGPAPAPYPDRRRGTEPGLRQGERGSGLPRSGDLFGPLPELSPPGPAAPPRPRQAPDAPGPDAAHGAAGTPDLAEPPQPLRAALRGGTLTGVPALLGSPGEDELLDELRQPDLTMEAVFVLLDELTERLRVHRLGPSARHALCTEILRSGLYLASSRHWSGPPADPAHRLARAAELFALVVVPVVRDPRHLDDLTGLAERIGRNPRSLLGDWLRACVLALPPGRGGVPGRPGAPTSAGTRRGTGRCTGSPCTGRGA